MTLTEGPTVVTTLPRTQFAGFDCGDYPGDSVMTAWAGRESPYSFVCYYLDAPCHSRRGFIQPWSGHRQLLDQLGWGFVITYVGRQAIACGSAELSRATGLADGADAVAKTRAEGFPRRAIIFLDVEAIQTAAEIAPYIAYFKGWIAAVIDSEYRSGIYCTAADRMILAVASGEECAAKNPVGTDKSEFWIAFLTPKFSIRSETSACGVPYALIWQGCFSIRSEIHNGASIPVIDLDVATSPDPSAGRVAIS